VLLFSSAGVGRTGVLIGMLTAWSCIDAGVAVDIMAIVQQMRSQRPVLVQTAVSVRATLKHFSLAVLTFRKPDCILILCICVH